MPNRNRSLLTCLSLTLGLLVAPIATMATAVADTGDIVNLKASAAEYAPQASASDSIVVIRNPRCVAPQAEGEVSTCMEVRPLTSDTTTSQVELKAGIPAPSWCYGQGLDRVLGDRNHTCETTKFVYTLTERIRGVVTVKGSMTGLAYRLQYSDSSSGTRYFGDQVVLYPLTMSGAASTTTVTGSGKCTGSCTAAQSNTLPTTALRLRTDTVGESFYDITGLTKGSKGAIITGGVGRATSGWDFNFTSPGYPTAKMNPSVGNFYMRCDNVSGSANPGCVNPWATPVLTYAYSRYPEFSSHVQRAQGSGLPSTLTRLNGDEADSAAACPSSLVRPTGKSCDEYPFASSKESAKVTRAPARTFAGCSITGDPIGFPGQGPNGFSRCMINASQNSGAGAVAGIFYARQRVIDGDQFRVAIS